MTGKPNKLRARIFMVVYMCAVTFVCISAVSAIHLVSADAVAANARLYLETGIMAAAGKPVPEDPAAVRAWYRENVSEHDGKAGRYYETTDAYVFPRRGAGLWGTIQAVVGMDKQLKGFTGISFISHNETPGLGARIEEPWFREQVAHKRGRVALVPEGTRSDDPHKLDAITGATITSTAVRDMLNGLTAAAPGIVDGAATTAE